MKNIINIIGFQISWWTCILGATSSFKYLGPLVMMVFIASYFYFYLEDKKEIYLLLFFGAFGTVIDSLFINYASFVYEGSYSEYSVIAPAWITAMWCGFAGTVNHSMTWFKDKWILCTVLGAIFGPLSYLTGAKFGAISFLADSSSHIIILAIVWGISMPLIFLINKFVLE